MAPRLLCGAVYRFVSVLIIGNNWGVMGSFCLTDSPFVLTIPFITFDKTHLL